MSGDQWIALAGVTAGAVGAIGGLLFGYFNGRSERTAARALARSGRLHGQRLEAYVSLAAFLERQRLFLARTEPIIQIGPGQPPPAQPTDEEWLTMQGRAAVAGSDDVDVAVKEAHRAFGAFGGAVLTYRGVRDQGGNAYGVGGPREQMDNARVTAADAIDSAQRAMRDELAAL